MTFDKLKSQKEDQNPLAGDALSLSKWEIKKLGEVCEIELGKTPYRGDKSLWDITKKTQNVWLSIADLLNTDSKFVYDSKEYVTDKAIRGLKVVQKGTLLVSFKLTLGRLAFAGRDLFTNEAIAALSIKDEHILDKYFLYQVLSFFDWHKAAEGDVKVKGKTLNKAKLKEIPIPLPPLAEQKKIVEVLDQAFAGIEQSRQNTKQNLKNAKEIFESYLQGVFENKGDDWEEKKLGEVCEVGAGNSAPQDKDLFLKGTYPFFRTSDVGRVKKGFIDSSIDRLNDEGIKKLKLFSKGTILFPKSGASTFLNHRVMMNVDGYVSSHLATIKSKAEYLNDKFLLYYLITIDAKHLMQDISYPSLKISDIKQIPIPLPPLAEQKKIVQELAALKTQTEALEQIYTQKLNSLDELQKSLLQKAFAGELVK